MSPSNALPLPALRLGARAGLLGAVGTWLSVVVPVVLGWVVGSQPGSTWVSAAGLGSSAWFLAHGAALHSSVTISVVPVLLTVVFVWFAKRGVTRALDQARQASERKSYGRDAVRGVVPGFVGAWFAWALVAFAFTRATDARPGPLALLTALLVPAVGVVAALLLAPDGLRVPRVDGLWARTPWWFDSAWRAGWRGVATLAALGAALVVGRLVTAASTVGAVHEQLALGLMPTLLVVLLQLAYLGNLATWALAFVAGPGFQVGAGATVSTAAAHPGLVPLLPVLGALPDEADFTGAMFLVIALPVLVGLLVARWLDLDLTDTADADELDAASPARRLLWAATAAVIAWLPVAALAMLGKGSLGNGRLAQVGPLPLSLVALLGELLLGAAVGALVVGRVRAGRTSSSRTGPE